LGYITKFFWKTLVQTLTHQKKNFKLNFLLMKIHKKCSSQLQILFH
jgi:hypothetical protein